MMTYDIDQPDSMGLRMKLKLIIFSPFGVLNKALVKSEFLG